MMFALGFIAGVLVSILCVLAVRKNVSHRVVSIMKNNKAEVVPMDDPLDQVDI